MKISDYKWGELRREFESRFNLSELNTLCSDLRIEYENFPQTKINFIREFLEYVKRHRLEFKLLDWLEKNLPDIQWNHYFLTKDWLQKFCSLQVTRRIAPLFEEEYQPEFYCSRKSVREAFREFLTTNHLSFALIGEADRGKTNELCVLAERLIKTGGYFALFFSCERINSLKDAIRDDFEQEFKNRKSLDQIIEQITEVLRHSQTKLFLIIDGLDASANQQFIRNEIVDLVTRLDPDYFRLFVSCKTLNWSFFVKEKNIQATKLNSFGNTVFPKQNDKTPLPGYWLDQFNEEELADAWEKYSAFFNIPGQLEGETRQACHEPIILRLLSELFKGNTGPVSPQLNNNEIFENYWTYQVRKFGSQQEQILVKKGLLAIADKMIESDSSKLNEEALPLEILNLSVYEDLFLHGFLIRINYDNESHLKFRFEKLRPFLYVTKSRDWQSITGTRQIVAEVATAMQTQLGQEALIFFLSMFESEWLLRLIETDYRLFLQLVLLVERLNNHPVFSIDIKSEKSVADLKKRVGKFISAYSLQRNAFPILKRRIAPHTQGDVGLWFFKRYYGFRGLTSKYPQKVVQVSESTAIEILSGPLKDKTYQELLPGGVIQFGGLLDELATNLPEFVAFTKISETLVDLISEQLLDESPCPFILSERIKNILDRGPGGVSGSPRGRYFQLLSFASVEQAVSTKCSELINRVNELLKEWEISSLEAEPMLKRWYDLQVPHLIVLRWYLEHLEKLNDHLIFNEGNETSIFLLHHRGQFEAAQDTVLELTIQTLESFSRLVEHNFPAFADGFLAYKCYQEKYRLILEANRLGSVTCIWLPSAPSGEVIVRFVDPFETPLGEIIPAEEDPDSKFSFAGIRAKSGASISCLPSPFPQSKTHANYSKISFMHNIIVETEIDGKMYHEPAAVISSFSLNSVADSVYHLLGNEINSIFGREFEKTFRQKRFGQSASISAKKAMHYIGPPRPSFARQITMPNSPIDISWIDLYD